MYNFITKLVERRKTSYLKKCVIFVVLNM